MDLKSKHVPNYLLCLPRGGFNDIITVIMRCHDYAEKYNRILVIDTSGSFLKDDIQKYIQMESPLVYKHDLSIFYGGTYRDTFPSLFHGNLDSIIPSYNNCRRCYCVKDTSTAIALDQSYPTQVIVYCNCGGGVDMTRFLRISHFQSLVVDEMCRRIRHISVPYTGIHIRNTDRKSHVKEFIHHHLTKLQNLNVFVASDNSETIETIKHQLQKQKCIVYTFANIPKYQGKCIHYHHKDVPTEEFNIDVMVDFLLLVHAKTYLYSCQNSGYSLAIKEVRQNKDVMKKLETRLQQTLSESI